MVWALFQGGSISRNLSNLHLSSSSKTTFSGHHSFFIPTKLGHNFSLQKTNFLTSSTLHGFQHSFFSTSHLKSRSTFESNFNFSGFKTNFNWKSKNYQYSNYYDFESIFKRNFSSSQKQNNSSSNDQKTKNKNLALIMVSVILAGVALSYASVPLYRLFCQATGYGGTVQIGKKVEDLEVQEVKEDLSKFPIVVHFNADTHAQMVWKFHPLQPSITVIPGESVLVFYRVSNPTNEAITGVSTYNVTPSRAGLYFNKIQCFCFEEQRLEPGEEIDLPVFFFIDPEVIQDRKTRNIRELYLSYTFFKTQ